MPSDYSQRIEEARAVSVLSVLEAHGFNYGKREGESIHFDRKNSKWRINVTGQRWFDHKAHKGGYGAIDLISHIANYSFRDAVEYLTGSYMAQHIADQKQKPKANQRPSMSFSDQLERYADNTPHRWVEARSYLINNRKLDPQIIDELHHLGSIYPNQYGSAVFVHHDLNGKMKGVTVRPSKDSKRFHMALGSKHEGFFRCGNLYQDPIAITESPIDAISYYQMNGRPAVSTGGLFIPQKLMSYIRNNNPRVILAFDNDSKKETFEAIKRIADLLKSENIRYEEHSPVSKDWNQDLKNLADLNATRKQ